MTPAPRPLAELVARLAAQGRVRGTRLDGRPVGSGALGDLVVRAPVTHDSRVVEPGGVFVAVPG